MIFFPRDGDISNRTVMMSGSGAGGVCNLKGRMTKCLQCKVTDIELYLQWVRKYFLTPLFAFCQIVTRASGTGGKQASFLTKPWSLTVCFPEVGIPSPETFLEMPMRPEAEALLSNFNLKT